MSSSFLSSSFLSRSFLSSIAFLALAVSLPTSGVATAQNPTEAPVETVSEAPRADYAVLCHFKATVIGMNSMGYTCTVSSPWIPKEECELGKSMAAAAAREAAMAAGCTEIRIVYDCVPKQFCVCCNDTTVAAVRSPACLYEVTYRLRCCDGQLLTYTVKDSDYRIAKMRAKDAVCFWASLVCDSQVRYLCWTTRRVPG